MRMILFLIFVLNTPILAAGNNDTKNSLDLKEFILRAESHDPNLKKILQDNNKLTFIVDEGLPTRQITLNADFEYGYGIGASQNTKIITGSASKEFIETGTTLSVSHTKVTRPDRQEDVTEVKLEQSLFRNLFGRDVRLKKEALKDEEQIVKLQVLESYEEYLAAILVEYLDYQKSFLDQELSKVALNVFNKLNTNVSQRLQKSIATQTDLDKTKLQYILQQEDQTEKQRLLDEKWERIKNITGALSPLSPDPSILTLIYKRFNEAKSSIGSFESLRSLRQFKIAELQRNQNEKTLTLAQRSNYPDLSLIGGYGIDNSSRFNATVNRRETILGVSLEIPLWDTVTSASVKSALLDLNKSELEKAVVSQNLQEAINQLKLLIGELQQKQNFANEKVILSTRILRDEKRRYRNGRLSLDDLIELETNHMNYQYQKQADDLELGKAILNWLSLTDQLLIFRDSLGS